MDHPAGLRSQVRTVASLRPDERDKMFQLFADHFANVKREQFDLDLAEKEWAIVVTAVDSERIEGFSTMRGLREEVDGKEVRALFTGDTVFQPELQASREYTGVLFRHYLTVAETMPAPVYWLLLTSTYRSYRFLPFLFQRYYPSPDWPTPPEIDRLRAALAGRKFPDEYDASRGVVVLKEATPRKVLPDIPGQRKKNPYVAYFSKVNPGHVNGDFLVCLVEFTRENLTAEGKWLLDV